MLEKIKMYIQSLSEIIKGNNFYQLMWISIILIPETKVTQEKKAID